MTEQSNKKDFSIAIIGSGFSGICLGIQLKKAGYQNFTIFEKASSLGGTWRDNTYPGAECDIPSALYSFSFEPNPNWTRKWSEQEEILEYMEHCSKKYDLLPHFRFNETCEALHFQEDKQNWLVTLSSGSYEFDMVASGVGQLHKPFFAPIPGKENFQGKCFHSAQWNHDVELNEKVVNVIGNAASAVQFIPQITPKVKQLNIFQRSPNWISEKKDRPHFAIEKWIGRAFPFLTKIYRFYIWFMADFLLYQIMNIDGNKFIRNKSKQDCMDFMKEHVKDQEKLHKLIPDYPIGAKRVLFSDDYYPAVAQNHVHIITDSVEEITQTGIKTKDKNYPADVIIFATGFETTRFLTPMQVIGKNGLHLNALWEEQGAEAYLGITHTGFPNFFMMYGPNTNLGHNSIIIMIEAQVRYILSCLEKLEATKCKTLEVRAEVQSEYNQWLQTGMQNKVWSKVENSWYKEKGKVTNNWVGRTSEYRKITREMKPEDYQIS